MTQHPTHEEIADKLFLLLYGGMCLDDRPSNAHSLILSALAQAAPGWREVSESDPAILAVAEAWASVDGKSEQYRAGKNAKSFAEECELYGGHYSGYRAGAAELMLRVQKRGFQLAPIPPAPSPEKKD